MAYPVFCMKNTKIFFNSVDFLSTKDLGRKVVELSWKSCVDNYESWIDDWKNYYCNLESWVDDSKNCGYDWDVGSDLTLNGH